MNIAVIGSGISGVVSSYLLSKKHSVTLFEAADYLGGHTHTIPVNSEGRTWNIDTGFIVYNDLNYPFFKKFLSHLEIQTQPSDMSFSVHCEKTGIEYKSSNLDTLFAQRKNIFNFSFVKMITEILRFNKESLELLHSEDFSLTILDYLRRRKYSESFIQLYIIPMGASIWSANPEKGMTQFPARSLVEFFHNHGMLSVSEKPQWRVLTGGSFQYIKKFEQVFRGQIKLNTPIIWAHRNNQGVELKSTNGQSFQFDCAVFAVHSDQALKILSDATGDEKRVLGAIQYQENETVLHTDSNVLPKLKKAWASWNYYAPEKSHDRVAITYYMNALQGLESEVPFCVTLNQTPMIDPQKIIKKIIYHHPIFTPEAVSAQKEYALINGPLKTYFCGAYWGDGFHEDGVESALAVCNYFDLSL